MKDTLLLLPRFLLTMALCVAVLSGVMLIAASLEHSFVALDKPLVLSWTVRNGGAVFVSGLLFAVFSALFRLVRRPGIKPLSFAILLLMVVVSGFFGLLGLGNAAAGVKEFPEPRAVPVSQGIIKKSGSAYLWVGALDGAILRNVLTYGVGREEFRLHPEAVYKPETMSVRLLDTGEEIKPGRPSAVNPPFFLRSVFADISHLAAFLTPRSLFDWKSAIRICVVSFFLLSLWTLVRLTRWPLFNLFMALGTFRAAVFFVRFLGKDFLPEAAKILQPGPLLADIPLAVLGISGIILFFICLLMKPLADWKRDLDYD